MNNKLDDEKQKQSNDVCVQSKSTISTLFQKKNLSYQMVLCKTGLKTTNAESAVLAVIHSVMHLKSIFDHVIDLKDKQYYLNQIQKRLFLGL